MMVRRRIRRCTLEACQHQSSFMQEICLKPLTKALCLLLPKTPPRNIEYFVKKRLEIAVTLKTEFAKEPETYRFFVIAPGQQYRNSNMHTSEEGGPKVMMCIFPGLMRKFGGQRAKSNVIVVPAKVLLEPKEEERKN